MTTQTYATQVTTYFLDAIAAAEAGGSMVNIAGGTLIVGDGNGVVPSISALIAANGVIHQVWSGTIAGVNVDANNAAQLDIQCVIPASIGGVEIGPFAVTEFAILDALGNCCVVGTTNLQKTVSSEGMISDLAWTAAVVNGVGAVTVTPPSAGFATMGGVIAAYNENLPSAVAPLTQTDTTNPAGWKNRVFGARLASKPADPVTTAGDAAGIGVGRPASAAEFAAGAGTSGDFPWPWPTLQQIAGILLGRLINIQVLATSGTYTPTLGTKSVLVGGAGGGGGGGGCPAPGSGYGAVGGAGAAAYSGWSYFTAGFAGVAVAIGAGGAGGAAGAHAGAAGGASSFGALMSLPGGAAGAAGGAASGSGQYNAGYPTQSSGATGVNLYGDAGQNSVGVAQSGYVSAGYGGRTLFGSGGDPGTPTGGAAGVSWGTGGGGGKSLSGSAEPGGAGAGGGFVVFEFG